MVWGFFRLDQDFMDNSGENFSFFDQDFMDNSGGNITPYFSSSPLNDSSKTSNNLLNVWILLVLYVAAHAPPYVCSLIMSLMNPISITTDTLYFLAIPLLTWLQSCSSHWHFVRTLWQTIALRGKIPAPKETC